MLALSIGAAMLMSYRFLDIRAAIASPNYALALAGLAVGSGLLVILVKALRTRSILNIAIAAFQAGRVADAEQLLMRFLRIRPKHVGALNLIAVLLMQTGRHSEAES